MKNGGFLKWWGAIPKSSKSLGPCFRVFQPMVTTGDPPFCETHHLSLNLRISQILGKATPPLFRHVMLTFAQGYADILAYHGGSPSDPGQLRPWLFYVIFKGAPKVEDLSSFIMSYHDLSS